MGWYRVVKTIKGHRYVYEQRTWREGKRVRTESRYIGPADGQGMPSTRGLTLQNASEPGRGDGELDAATSVPFDKVGGGNSTFNRGDLVRATNKKTGETR